MADHKPHQAKKKEPWVVHPSTFHDPTGSYTGSDEGLKPPDRLIGLRHDLPFVVARTAVGLDHANTLACLPACLYIKNLDRADPPGYKPNSFPRGKYNKNVFKLTAAPKMPDLAITCQVDGFDPKTTPILWRLQCLHVLGRPMPLGHYTYAAHVERLAREWQGKAKAASFTLFDPGDANVTYDFGGRADEQVMGGDALLSVAAWPAGMTKPLVDYVHLRIGGTNPGKTEVVGLVDRVMAGRNANIVHMVRAAFGHESGYRQFSSGTQTSRTMTFSQRHHQDHTEQPDCVVSYDFPDDPADYPMVAFDFGIGVSQYTVTPHQPCSAGVVWDWRENVKKGINVLFGKMNHTYKKATDWNKWAELSWAAYNGTGAQAERYGRDLLVSAEGRQIVNGPLPTQASLAHDLAPLSGLADQGAAPDWPKKPAT